ncbi:MAG: GNAT family N-acetyltransferase [Saprospirales bacterium]|nr:GNAT family N-acetyltransferase [Saprospirales bacterium]
MLLSIAAPADIQEMLRLINRAYRGEPSRAGWTTEADYLAGDIRSDPDDLAEHMNRPAAVFLKVDDGTGAIAGCVFLEKHAARLYLGMLSVWPEMQNRGIGKLLLDGAEAQARAFGCSSIYMQVISLRTELLEWYERHGYSPTGERKPFVSPLKFGVPQVPLEFVILEKMLPGA